LPPAEVAGVVPTVVVEVEEESPMEVLEARASIEQEMGDQAVRIGVEFVLETVEKEMGEQVFRTRDEPILEAVEERTGDEPVLKDVEMGTGDVHVHDMGEGDSHFKDYPGDDFEKVGEFTPEETSQSPTTPALENLAEEPPASSEPRRKRFKTLAGRTDLPWVRKLIALRSKTSPSSQHTPRKQPFQPTRKSHRLAA